MAARGVHEYREQGFLFITADLAVIYKSQAKYGDTLIIDMTVSAFHQFGCDVTYRVTNRSTKDTIALAKTAHIVLDPVTNRPIEPPIMFKQKLTV